MNLAYLKRGQLFVQPLPNDFLWHDVGNASRILEASCNISNIQKAGDIFVGCIECAAYRKGYIKLPELERLSEAVNTSEYGKYLTNFCESEK